MEFVLIGVFVFGFVFKRELEIPVKFFKHVLIRTGEIRSERKAEQLAAEERAALKLAHYDEVLKWYEYHMGDTALVLKECNPIHVELWKEIIKEIEE